VWIAVAPRTANPAPSRFILPILGLVALGACVGGILVLIDPHGGQNLLAGIYDSLGNSSGAQDLRNGQGDQLIAKLILALIALGVAVGGIWLLFLGVADWSGCSGRSGAIGSCRGCCGPGTQSCWPYLLYPVAPSPAASSIPREGSPSITTP
jgi:hypothetical protein